MKPHLLPGGCSCDDPIEKAAQFFSEVKADCQAAQAGRATFTLMSGVKMSS